LEELGIDGRIIIKLIVKIVRVGTGLNSVKSLMLGICDHGNEHSIIFERHELTLLICWLKRLCNNVRS
jgi:hypothetical protein